MPEDLTESVSGSTELVFPDDADGSVYSLQERDVYGAEEVRNEMETDIPKYGSWLRVELENGDEAWLNAPSQLRSVLVEDGISHGEQFRIDQIKKRGIDQSDPYVVQVSYPDRKQTPENQTNLKNSS